MRRFIIFLVSIISLSALAERITVVAADSGEKLAGASILSANGNILGISDENGVFEAAASQFPLKVRCVGYNPAKADKPGSVVSLTPALYSLPSLEVIPGERPIAKVICYAREYTTSISGADSVQLYADYMATYFIAEEKQKGYDKQGRKPIIKNSRYRARISAESDSIIDIKDGDRTTYMFMYKMLGTLPGKKVEVPEEIRQGATSYTLQGKYSPLKIYAKSPKLFTVTTDLLSEYKDHSLSPSMLKLIGMTLDFQQLQFTDAYRAGDEQVYDINSLVVTGANWHTEAKGKWFKMAFKTKNDIHLNIILEIYPVNIEYLTMDEYKEAKKDKTPIEFSTPINLDPLAPIFIK